VARRAARAKVVGDPPAWFFWQARRSCVGGGVAAGTVGHGRSDGRAAETRRARVVCEAGGGGCRSVVRGAPARSPDAAAGGRRVGVVWLSPVRLGGGQRVQTLVGGVYK